MPSSDWGIRPRTIAYRKMPWIRRQRMGTISGKAALIGLAPNVWYDSQDFLTATQQTITNRVGSTTLQMGATTGVDASDPVVCHNTRYTYVYLPGTANNNLSVPKTGGWAGTIHVTATLTDDTTATYTTTADPVLIGNTLLTAGRYKLFTLRDTDSNGTVRVTINPQTETVGHTTWTCTTGQTVTVNRSTTSFYTSIVDGPMFQTDGSAAYGQLASGDTPTFTKSAGGFTLLVTGRFRTTAGNTAFWSGESADSNGAMLWATAPGVLVARVGSGSAVDVTHGTGLCDGTLRTFGLVVSAGTLYAYERGLGLSAGSSIAGLAGSITHATPKVGVRAYASSLPSRFACRSIVQFPSALTLAQLNTAADYLQSTHA